MPGSASLVTLVTSAESLVRRVRYASRLRVFSGEAVSFGITDFSRAIVAVSALEIE